MKDEPKTDKEVKKILNEAIDDLDENFRKTGRNFLKVIANIIEDKVSKIWEKNKIIVKNKIDKETKDG